MADSKISALSDGTTPALTDQFVVARSGGTTVKLTWAELQLASRTSVYPLGADGFSSLSMPVSSSVNPGANAMQGMRLTMPKTGTLTDLYVYVTVQSGNAKLLVYDTGQTLSSNVRTLLYNSGAIDISAATNTWKGTAGSTGLAVTLGETLDFGVTCDGATAKFLGSGNIFNSAESTLPANFLPSSGTGTASPKLVFNVSSAYVTPPTTIAEASVNASANEAPLFLFRIV